MGRKKKVAKEVCGRRQYSTEFKEEAVQMLLEGHSAPKVAANLGLSGPGLLYRWKAHILGSSTESVGVFLR